MRNVNHLQHIAKLQFSRYRETLAVRLKNVSYAKSRVSFTLQRVANTSNSTYVAFDDVTWRIAG